ncbi:MAG TPA: alpha/beta hydrolase [Solirubrobacteraceae bacterium]|nr:alpha/beta hydrolase [Solirubrobacteraceae bacterium]
MTREYSVTGGGGVALHVREFGKPDGAAIVFVHGWSQCDRCWDRQLEGQLAASFRLVAFDIRGHGMSDKPSDPACYTDGQLWADDLAAVINAGGLERPVVVAWSYGGFILADYVRAYGDGALGGIVLAGSALHLNPTTFADLGPGLLENAQAMCLPDLGANIAATRRFLRACTVDPLDADLWEAALCWNMVVPPQIRGALIAREIDADDVLATLSVPVLVIHGAEDSIVLPSMARHAVERCPTAAASWYDGVGHMPFVEAQERFDQDLAAFARAGRPSTAMT